MDVLVVFGISGLLLISPVLFWVDNLKASPIALAIALLLILLNKDA